MQWEFTGLPVALVGVGVEGEEVTLGVTAAVSLTVVSRSRGLII